jgi:hypothetical protein
MEELVVSVFRVVSKRGGSKLLRNGDNNLPIDMVSYPRRRESSKIHICIYIYIYISKAIPLQALTGPKGFRRLRLPDFKTIGT